MSYTTANSGKSMSRVLGAVIVIGVVAGFDAWCWRHDSLPAIWGAIIASVCALVGTPWALSHVKKVQP